MAFVEEVPHLLLFWNRAVLRTGNGPGYWFIMVFFGFFTCMAHVLSSTKKANVKCQILFLQNRLQNSGFFKAFSTSCMLTVDKANTSPLCYSFLKE